MNNPVKKAIDIVGSQTELARRCHVWQQTVSKWLYKGYVPFESVDKVVVAVNGKMTAEDLCPQIKTIRKLHKQATQYID